MLQRLCAALIAAAVLTSAGGLAGAQGNNLYTRPTEGVLLPSPSLTETRDATAIAVNPANLALLDSWNFMYVGSWLGDQQRLTGQGHGFFFAFPFFIAPVSLGLAVEALTPPDSIKAWQGLDDRARFSLSAAFHLWRSIAFAITYRTFWGYDLGEIHTCDIGLSVHPINHLAIAFAMADLNAPRIRYDSPERAQRRFNVGLTVRPLGNDRLSLGGEFNYLFGNDLNRTDATAILGAMLVDGLSVRARFGAEGIRGGDYEKGYFVDASLVFDLPRFGVGVSLHGQVYPHDRSEYQGTTWQIGFHGDEAPALVWPRALRSVHAVLIDVDQKLSTGKLAGLADRLQRIETDDGADMVVLRPAAGSISLSESREIRRRVDGLQAAGKKVICYLTEATGSEYLACSGADKIWINPAGGVRLAGISATGYYFRGLFDKIGVKADVVRTGEYKSAPEMYTERGPSEAATEEMERYLDSAYENLLATLAADRKLGKAEDAKKVVEAGPFTARESVKYRLADKVVPADTLDAELKDLTGGPVFLDDGYGKVPLRHRRYLDSPAVAVVHIEGDIIDGESYYIPLLDIRMSGAKTLTGILRDLREDRRIRAVVLRIDSPGGSALASDMIWREVMALRKEKPVIASLGSVAASGAYYVASAASEIYAEATTVTGSIGVYYGKADLSGLIGKIGVDVTTFKRGDHADQDSWWRPYTEEERARLGRQINEFYALFKDRVVEGRGRGFNRDIVEKVAGGRIWSGADAKYHLLVDQIGGYREAVDRARALGHVPSDIMVFHKHVPKQSLLLRLLGGFKSMVQEPGLFELLVSTANLKPVLRSIVPFAAADPGAPRARLPFALVEQ